MLPNRSERNITTNTQVASENVLNDISKTKVTKSDIIYSSSVDSLPEEFLSSLRILFGILDSDNTGYVLFTDIEAYWHLKNESAQVENSLPDGVLQALHEMSLPNGTLSFDRFIMGLKLALLESDSKDLNVTNPGQTSNNMIPTSTNHKGNVFMKRKDNRPAADAQNHYLPSRMHEYNTTKSTMRNKPIMATVRPNNVLDPTDNKPRNNSVNSDTALVLPLYKTRNSVRSHPDISRSTKPTSPPPIPPRHSSKNVIRRDVKPSQAEQQSSNIAVCYGTNRTQSDSKLQDKENSHFSTYQNLEELSRPTGEGNHVTVARTTRPPGRPYTRRHTLTNAIDNNMIKRMRQLEEEKDILLKGLVGAEGILTWYQQQIAAVEGKLQSIGHSPHVEATLEMNGERVNLLKSRIQMVNRHMSALVDVSSKSIPHHINLATHGSAPSRESWSTLTNENKRLTQALSEQNHRITKLEGEKCSLLRQLFGITANEKASYSDTTLL